MKHSHPPSINRVHSLWCMQQYGFKSVVYDFKSVVWGWRGYYAETFPVLWYRGQARERRRLMAAISLQRCGLLPGGGGGGAGMGEAHPLNWRMVRMATVLYGHTAVEVRRKMWRVVHGVWRRGGLEGRADVGAREYMWGSLMWCLSCFPWSSWKINCKKILHFFKYCAVNSPPLVDNPRVCVCVEAFFPGGWGWGGFLCLSFCMCPHMDYGGRFVMLRRPPSWH